MPLLEQGRASVGRVLTFLAVSAVVVCSGFALRVVWESSSGLAQAQTTGTCPNAQLIDTFEGTGNQQTDTFDTTTDSFRVSYNVTGSDPATPATLIIDVIDANDPNQLSVGSATQEGNGRGETFVNAPPGTYYLDITFLFGNYTVTVEQCEGGNPDQNPGSPPPGSPPPGTPPVPPIDRGPGEDLLDAGGSQSGPLPPMADGTCPKEFPVNRDGACYE
jgi:hypothetical protein